MRKIKHKRTINESDKNVQHLTFLYDGEKHGFTYWITENNFTNIRTLIRTKHTMIEALDKK